MTPRAPAPIHRLTLVVPAFVVVALLATAAGCQPDTPPVPAPTPVELTWQEIALPPAPAGYVNAVRAVTYCPGHWYATGAWVAPSAEPRPAAWSSPDGRQWTALAAQPETYYGERNTLYAAACRDDRLVAIGARSGGAHGNPRISTWYQAGSRMVEVEARPYTLFGGENAVNTSRIAGGRHGWMLTGNRVSGAAAWFSATGERFGIIERAPGLASADGMETYASDVVAVGSGWLIVGARTPSGGSRDPAAWFSSDGQAWQLQPAPGDPSYEELQRVVAREDALIAAGPRGNGYGVWSRRAAGDGVGGGWEFDGSFGRVDGAIPGSVNSLVDTGVGLLTVVRNGLRYEIWQSGQSRANWQAVALPAPGPEGPDGTVTAAAGGGLVVVVVDDGRGSRLFARTP